MVEPTYILFRTSTILPVTSNTWSIILSFVLMLLTCMEKLLMDGLGQAFSSNPLTTICSALILYFTAGSLLSWMVTVPTLSPKTAFVTFVNCTINCSSPSAMLSAYIVMVIIADTAPGGMITVPLPSSL